MDREKIKIQTKTIKLIPSDEVLNTLEKEAAQLQKDIDLLKTVDISNVRPMVRMDETPTSFLRDDVAELIHPTLGQEEVLANAPRRETAFIAVRKAAKND